MMLMMLMSMNMAQSVKNLLSSAALKMKRERTSPTGMNNIFGIIAKTGAHQTGM